MSEIEVEAKYPLADSVEQWRQRLVDLGAAVRPSMRQSDEYFAHPARDFVATREAFRIRTVGEHNALTYKGPPLDSCTKSRRELEIEFACGDNQAQQMRAMLIALGFQPAGRVCKHRIPLEIDWHGRPFSVALDDVDGLGMFLEIETLATEAEWTAARDLLLEFAAEFGLMRSERRSYLELLLAAREFPHGN